MTTTDQLRNALRDLEAKAKEMELDKKLTTFADQADHYLQRAATKAGELAHDNRERIDEQLARAGDAVDGKTEGKYSSYVGKVRTGVMTGVDWVADQRPATAAPGADPAHTAEASPASAAPAPSDVSDSTPSDSTPSDSTPSGAAADANEH
ncbi:MAG: antitoxin [Ornithinibacter sp.]